MRYKIAALIIFIIIIMMITPSFASVNIQSQYNTSTESVSPYIIYNNTHNYPPFAETTTNKYHTLATSDITSIWADASYSMDVYSMGTNTYGDTIVFDFETGQYYFIGSPYDTCAYRGPITGIAGTSNFDNSGNPLIVLLTQYGYIFGYHYSQTSGKYIWNLFVNSYTNDPIKLAGDNWTSLTANTYATVESDDSYFYATNLNGTVYDWNANTGNYGLFNSALAPKGIISTAAYYDECSISDNNLFGLSYSGTIYYLSSQGWEIFNSTPLPTGEISIAISGLYYPYLYALNIHNNSSLYVSTREISDVTSSTFKETTGIIDNQETNEALTIYCGEYTTYPVFYAMETNGTTMIYKSGVYDTTDFNWGLLGNDRFPCYYYPEFLALNSVNNTNTFHAILSYNSSINLKNIQNLNYFIMYYNNSDLYEEFSYINGTEKDYGTPVLINSSTPIAINITLRPNSAYNANLQFLVVYYYHGVYIGYLLNIDIINHFSYWKLN